MESARHKRTRTEQFHCNAGPVVVRFSGMGRAGGQQGAGKGLGSDAQQTQSSSLGDESVPGTGVLTAVRLRKGI